jgi:hypothetical protein
MTNNNGTNSDSTQETCPYCSKANCKSEFHHKQRCIYCNKITHTCCDEDCKLINKLPPIPPETDLVEMIESKTTKKLEEIERFQIDMGVNPAISSVCESELCQVKWMMNVYKLAFEQYKNNDIKTKALDSTFRILMLRPEKFAQLVKNGTIDPTITPIEFVNARSFGWEKQTPEENQVFQTILEACFKRVIEIGIKQNSKVNVKKKLSDETLAKIAEHDRKLAEEKKAKAASASKPQLSKYEKLIQKTMHDFKCTREKAIEFQASIGNTEEVVK